MPKIEPEIIKQWREEFKIRTDKIEADADQEVKLVCLSVTTVFLLLSQQIRAVINMSVTCVFLGY